MDVRVLLWSQLLRPVSCCPEVIEAAGGREGAMVAGVFTDPVVGVEIVKVGFPVILVGAVVLEAPALLGSSEGSLAGS
jgi:hypothetical protein